MIKSFFKSAIFPALILLVSTCGPATNPASPTAVPATAKNKDRSTSTPEPIILAFEPSACEFQYKSRRWDMGILDGDFLVAGFIQITNGRFYDVILLRTDEGQVEK